MKVTITFDTDNAAWEDDPTGELHDVLEQAYAKVLEQINTPAATVCTAPEAMHKLLDINGNTVGSILVESPRAIPWEGRLHTVIHYCYRSERGRSNDYFACGADLNSSSSTTDVLAVTCPKCRRKLRRDDGRTG